MTDLHVVHAEEEFLAALAGVTSPRKKNAAASDTPSSTVSPRKRHELEGVHFLAQGTLYPDVIESGGLPDGPAATIKLHHNVGGLPEKTRILLDRTAPRSFQG